MSLFCRTARGAMTMNSTEKELEALIADSRQRTWNLQVMQMRPGQSPEDLALLKSLERSQRAETLRRRKALELHRTTIEHQKQGQPRPRIDRRKLLEGRLKAKAILAAPDFSDETRALAKKALDHADVALGLDDAIGRKLARTSSPIAEQALQVEAPVKAPPIKAPTVRQSDAPPVRPGIMARLWAQTMGPFFNYNEKQFRPVTLGSEIGQYFCMMGAGIVSMLMLAVIYGTLASVASLFGLHWR
jgi:hypothetical protein